MALSIGIVGLPNVGKSTLFTAMTNKGGLAANYPFATIEPNVGIVPVPDDRLQALAEIDHPAKIVPATVEFVDIAGLVAGASQGEGLGNQFLANIRETDAIAEVVRFFGEIVPATVEFVDIAGLVAGASQGEGLGNQFLANIRETDAIAEVVRFFGDPDVTHVAGKVDPQSDVDTIKTELILADIATVEKAIPRLEKEAKRDKSGAAKLEAARKVLAGLNEGHRARTLGLTEDEVAAIYELHLLTMKPMLYIANVDEGAVDAELPEIDGCTPVPISAKVEADIAELAEMDPDEAAVDAELPEIDGCTPVPISAKVEADIAELAEMDPDEAKEYMEALGLTDSGLARLIREAYHLLGLQSYFTSGETETRAWTIPVGAKAPQAAGVIHTRRRRHAFQVQRVGRENLADFLGRTGDVEEING